MTQSQAEIYSQAALIIAADWSPNCSGGLFPDDISHHNTLKPLVTKIHQTDVFGKSHPIYYLLDERKMDHTAKTVNHCYETANKRVLHKRAWCMQERALARRIVYFCDAEILWECRELTGPLCSCGGNASVDYLDYDYAVSPKSCRPERELEHGTENWKRIVQTYTRRSLTYEVDRLPAMGGLAKRLSIPGSAFIAGIWISDDTLDQLAWHSYEGHNRKSPPNGPIKRLPPDYAPSWSWASVAAPIKFRNWSQYIWDVVGSSFNLATEDPFGPVFNATLTLRCHVVPFLSLSASAMSTSLDTIVHGSCDIFWDAGMLAEEWCEEGYDFVLLVARFHYNGFCGMVVRRQILQERAAGKEREGPWQRIGVVQHHGGHRSRDSNFKTAKETWISQNPTREIVLE